MIKPLPILAVTATCATFGWLCYVAQHHKPMQTSAYVPAKPVQLYHETAYEKRQVEAVNSIVEQAIPELRRKQQRAEFSTQAKVDAGLGNLWAEK